MKRLAALWLMILVLIASVAIPMFSPTQVLAAPTHTTHITGGFDPGNHSAGYYYGLSGGNQGVYNGTNWFIHSSCLPVSGTLKNLRIEQTGTLGANRTYTITISGVATALSATVPAGSLTGENTTYSLAVSQNDLLSIQVGVSSLTVGGRWYMDFEVTGTDYFSLFLGNSYAPDFDGTYYHALTNQSDSENDNETMSYSVAPVDGVVSSLYCYQYITYGVGWSWSMTLRKNGVDTALTVSLTGHNHYVSSGASVSVTKGDWLNWEVTTTGGPWSHGIISYGAVFTPDSQDRERAVWMYGSPNTLSSIASEYNSFLPSQPAFAWGGLRDTIVQGEGLRATNLYVRLSAAPGAAASGKQYTFTLYVNSVSTALTCTVLNDATYAEDTTTSVFLANGDNLSINCTPLNSPNVVFATWGVVIKEEDPPLPADAMFEIWGTQGGAGRPAWYRALPSILKLLFIGWILAMAVITLRTEPKREEAGFNMPEMKE